MRSHTPTARHNAVLENPRWQKIDNLSKKNGPHSMIYLINGDKYLGDWKDNLKHGNGTYSYSRIGSVFEGEWEFDQRSGFGTLSEPHKAEAVTRENSRDSKESCQSKMTMPVVLKLRKVYAGQWRCDLRHGFGTFFYNDGSYFEGEWSDDMRQGWGKMHYLDGSVYVGQWYKEMRNGQGELLLPNGDRYEGMWLNNKKEGPGKFIFRAKRQIYEGEWSEDQPRCGALSDLPTLPGKDTRKYPIPVIGLKDPNDILSQEKEHIVQERLARMAQ